MPSNTNIKNQIGEFSMPFLLKPVIIKPKKLNHMDKDYYT